MSFISAEKSIAALRSASIGRVCSSSGGSGCGAMSRPTSIMISAPSVQRRISM